MAKTITIEDVVIKEAIIALVDGEYIMNVLCATVDSDGNEYPRGWEVYKDPDATSVISKDIEKVLKHAKDKSKEKEQL